MTEEEKWWFAIDQQGNVMRKSTNYKYLCEVARLKGWVVEPAQRDEH